MRALPLLLAALCTLVLLPGLGRVPALDWREARDAQVARELIRRHEALTPVLGGEALFEKPIPAYTPELLAQRHRPAVPRRSRQIRAALAVALVLLTASLGARHFGPRAGWLAALVLVSSLGLPLAARADGTQLLASLFGWVGCMGLADATFGHRPGRELRLVVAYGALGAALACAGPLPALWPLAALALYLRLAGRLGELRRAQPVAGLVLMLGVALPWYGAMAERHGAAFLAHAPFFPYGVEARGSWLAGPFLALSFLVFGFFPWCALLPGAMLHAATWWRRVRRPGPAAGSGAGDADPVHRERHEEDAAHFFVACVAAALLPVLLYPGPPLSAVLPALPAAALLCGRLLDHLVEDPRRVAHLTGRAAWMLALTGTVGAVLLAVIATRLADAAPRMRELATLLFVTAWLPFLATILRRPRLAAALIALPVAAGAPLVSLRLLPALEPWLETRAVAGAMLLAAPPRAPLALVQPPPPSLRLECDRNLVQTEPVPGALRASSASDGYAYLAFPPAREHAVAQAAAAPLEVLLRTPTLILARVRPG